MMKKSRKIAFEAAGVHLFESYLGVSTKSHLRVFIEGVSTECTVSEDTVRVAAEH
jgi:hypothetical protein